MTKEIKINFYNEKIEQKYKLPLTAGDRNAYKLSFDTEKFPDATQVMIFAEREDGEIIYDTVDILDKKASYILKENIYSVGGIVKIRCVLKNDNEDMLTTAIAVFDVIEAVEANAVAEDTDSFQNVIDKINSLTEFDDEPTEESEKLVISGGVYSALESKADCESIIEITTENVDVEIDENEYIVCKGVTNSISIGLSERCEQITYISELSFTTPDEVDENYISVPENIKFIGSDCKNDEFIPVKNKRYMIVFCNDGVDVVGLVSGVGV